MTDDRAENAMDDVVAVERIAPGMVRVVTWADAYVVDARDAGCNCPDKQYHEVERCKHEWAAILADADHPTPWDVTDSLDAQRLVTDGGGTWTVIDHANDNQREFDSRSEAEDALATLKDLGGEGELVPPGKDTDDYPTAECAICGDNVSIAEARSGPGGQPIHGNCYGDDTETDGGNAIVVEDPGADPEVEPATPEAAEQLPERSVADDPLTWMPGDFIDEIDGTPAINRKGFEVLAHFYDVDVYADLEVPPEETDFEFARVKARAVTADGRECEAYGSAHIDRGDDAELLLEMADTRARKRALSIATGVGAVAVEELKSEVNQ